MFEDRCDFSMRDFCDQTMEKVAAGMEVSEAAVRMFNRGVPLHVALRLLAPR